MASVSAFWSLALLLVPCAAEPGDNCSLTPEPGNCSSPCCAINLGVLPGYSSCPGPDWPVVWQLNASTLVLVEQPWSPSSGYFVPPASEPWGLVSLDWSVGNALWLHPDRNVSSCEATHTENARRIKQRFPTTRVFLYHNVELGLQWLESQRAVMYDPQKAHWFLRWPNGTVVNTHISQGDQFYWDFRCQAAADYFVASVVNSSTRYPWVDGTFLDDTDGFPDEHSSVAGALRLSGEEQHALRNATQRTAQRAMDGLHAAGKSSYQSLMYYLGGIAPGPTHDTCESWLRARCREDYQDMVFTQQPPATPADLAGLNTMRQQVASFLLVRTKYAWLGYGNGQVHWDPLFNTDVGEPRGTCKEGPRGVFSREWTRGLARLDCNAWVATLPGEPDAAVI